MCVYVCGLHGGVISSRYFLVSGFRLLADIYVRESLAKGKNKKQWLSYNYTHFVFNCVQINHISFIFLFGIFLAFLFQRYKLSVLQN